MNDEIVFPPHSQTKTPTFPLELNKSCGIEFYHFMVITENSWSMQIWMNKDKVPCSIIVRTLLVLTHCLHPLMVLGCSYKGFRFKRDQYFHHETIVYLISKLLHVYHVKQAINQVVRWVANQVVKWIIKSLIMCQVSCRSCHWLNQWSYVSPSELLIKMLD